jgi:hypothetical protein
VLVMPRNREELPRVYTSNGELMQNFMDFEMVRSSLTADTTLPLSAPYHAFLLYHMQPIDPLPHRRNEPFVFSLPSEFQGDQVFSEPVDFPCVEPLDPGIEIPQRVEPDPAVEATLTIETIIQRTQITLKGKLPILDL